MSCSGGRARRGRRAGAPVLVQDDGQVLAVRCDESRAWRVTPPRTPNRARYVPTALRSCIAHARCRAARGLLDGPALTRLLARRCSNERRGVALLQEETTRPARALRALATRSAPATTAPRSRNGTAAEDLPVGDRRARRLAAGARGGRLAASGRKANRSAARLRRPALARCAQAASAQEHERDGAARRSDRRARDRRSARRTRRAPMRSTRACSPCSRRNRRQVRGDGSVCCWRWAGPDRLELIAPLIARRIRSRARARVRNEAAAPGACDGGPSERRAEGRRRPSDESLLELALRCVYGLRHLGHYRPRADAVGSACASSWPSRPAAAVDAAAPPREERRKEPPAPARPLHRCRGHRPGAARQGEHLGQLVASPAPAWWNRRLEPFAERQQRLRRDLGRDAAPRDELHH